MGVSSLSLLAILAVLAGPVAHAAPTLEEPETWEEFWRKVESSNPSLQAEKAGVEASRSEVALALPAPMVAIGSMGMTSPTSGVMERSYEVTQTIPFPTKFFKAGTLKDRRIQAAAASETLAIQRVAWGAAEAFASLDESLQAQKTLAEHKDVLDRHVRRLKSLAISQQGQKIHIATIEADAKVIAAEILDLRQRELDFRNRLGGLLNLESPYMGIPRLKPAPVPPSEFGQPSRIAAVDAAKHAEEVSAAEATFAKQEWLPDLSLTYRKRNRYDGVMPSSHEVMIGLELPFLWGWDRSANVKSARARAEQMGFSAVAARREALNEISTLQGEVKSLWERMQLFKNEVLPLDQKSIQLLHRLVASDMETLDLHRVTLEKWLTDRMKFVRLEGDYRRASSRLEILTKDSPHLETL